MVSECGITEWSEGGCVHRTDKLSRRKYELSNGSIVIQCIYCGFVYQNEGV